MQAPDAAVPDAAPPPPDAPSIPVDAAPAPEGWFTISAAETSVVTTDARWRYGFGYLHETSGYALRDFLDPDTQEDYSGGFDAHYKNYAWDKTPVQFGTPVEGFNMVAIPVETALTKRIERVYYGFAGLEIEYLENTAEWTEDFIHVAGAEQEIAFVMYGMNDIVGVSEGKRIWNESALLAYSKYGQKINYGDTFIEANGSTVEQCLYKAHFIYGFINRTTGRGVGAVYPADVTVKDFRIWWTEANRIEIEFAPGGKPSKRWLFRVSGGRDEILRVGKRLVDAGRFVAP